MSKYNSAGTPSEQSCQYILCTNNMAIGPDTTQSMLQALSQSLGEQSKLMGNVLCASPVFAY